MLISDTRELVAAGYNGQGIVIAGAGAVGLHLANELVKRGQTVVVIESGEKTLGGFSPESFHSVGRSHEGIRLGRSRSLGGTSNLWGGQLVEFQPVDFGGRAWLPGSAWPVSYEEIQRYYAPTYEALGIPPLLQRDAAVWRSIGKEPPALGAGAEIFLTRWMKIPGLAVMLRREIEQNPRLFVLTGHTVVGFEGSSGKIKALQARSAAGTVVTIRGGRFVLAAGTIETVRLMLHTATTLDWECPWRGNRNVGAWFQDHLGGRVAEVRAHSPRQFFDVFCTVVSSMHKFAPKIRLGNATLERDRILNVQAMFDFESSVSENLVYLKQFAKAAIFSRQVRGIGDLLRHLRASARYLVPLMWRYVHDHRIFVPSSSKIALLVQAEQVPCEASRLTIDPGVVDACGLPRVVLDWRIDGKEELASIGEFVDRVRQALADANLGELAIDPRLRARDPVFLDTLRDTTHQAGGARMASSESDGVVDRDLRVFGTDNLYVAGAAAFRTVSNANTTFTAMAFATRLAEHLAGTAVETPTALESAR
jgi:choline dehydrogenase-like flavoprotein